MERFLWEALSFLVERRGKTSQQNLLLLLLLFSFRYIWPRSTQSPLLRRKAGDLSQIKHSLIRILWFHVSFLVKVWDQAHLCEVDECALEDRARVNEWRERKKKKTLQQGGGGKVEGEARCQSGCSFIYELTERWRALGQEQPTFMNK